MRVKISSRCSQKPTLYVFPLSTRAFRCFGLSRNVATVRTGRDNLEALKVTGQVGLLNHFHYKSTFEIIVVCTIMITENYLVLTTMYIMYTNYGKYNCFDLL